MKLSISTMGASGFRGAVAFGDGFLTDENVPGSERADVQAVLNEKMAKSLGFIKTAVLRLSSVVDALLRLSRAGRVEYRWQLVNVNSIAARSKPNPSTCQIPTNMLTTTDDPREVRRFCDLGRSSYVSKPVIYEKFVEAIRRLGLFLCIVEVPREIGKA